MLRVKINGNEVKNPFVGFVVGLVVLLASMMVLVVLLLIFLPIAWLAVSIGLTMLALFAICGPRLFRIARDRIVVIESKKDKE